MKFPGTSLFALFGSNVPRIRIRDENLQCTLDTIQEWKSNSDSRRYSGLNLAFSSTTKSSAQVVQALLNVLPTNTSIIKSLTISCDDDGAGKSVQNSIAFLLEGLVFGKHSGLVECLNFRPSGMSRRCYAALSRFLNQNDTLKALTTARRAHTDC